jgi:curli biogenesis system outer membrane secretion channel CsgG
MMRSPLRVLAGLAVVAALALAGCAPTTASGAQPGAGPTPAAQADASDRDLRPFSVEPLPRDERWVIAVPDFSVRAGSVRVAGRDPSGAPEAEGFETELGRGVSDVFATEAFRSGRFTVTEREQLAAVLREQDLGRSGRVDPDSAAEAGRVLGAEVLALGSVTEFGVEQTGGGGRLFGILGGSTETVTSRVSVDVRLVDAVTAEILAIGVGTAEASQSNVRIDLWNIVRGLGGGRSGTTIVDVAVRNAIRAAIDEAAAGLPPRPTR